MIARVHGRKEGIATASRQHSYLWSAPRVWQRARTLVYACIAVSLRAHRRAHSERGTGTSLCS